MDEKMVTKSLFKKLTAPRATLSDEEQALLDELVVGEHEASAHGMVKGAAAAAVKGVMQDAEAAAHGMVKGASAAAVKGVTQDADEAVAHGQYMGASAGAVKGVVYRIAYNAEKETYEVE